MNLFANGTGLYLFAAQGEELLLFGTPTPTASPASGGIADWVWVPWVIAVLAFFVSLIAVALNRNANRMKALDRQAFFKAEFIDVAPSAGKFMRLTNTGQASAGLLSVAFACDPNGILGMKGATVRPVEPGEFADFTFLQSSDRLSPDTKYAYPPAAEAREYDLWITWTDHFDRPRKLLIPSELCEKTTEEQQKSGSVPVRDDGLAVLLYEPSSRFARLVGKPKWRQREQHRH